MGDCPGSGVSPASSTALNISLFAALTEGVKVLKRKAVKSLGLLKTLIVLLCILNGI